MTCQQVVDELKIMANENVTRIFLNHSAKEPILGVKEENLKKIWKVKEKGIIGKKKKMARC